MFSALVRMAPRALFGAGAAFAAATTTAFAEDYFSTAGKAGEYFHDRPGGVYEMGWLNRDGSQQVEIYQNGKLVYSGLPNAQATSKPGNMGLSDEEVAMLADIAGRLETLESFTQAVALENELTDEELKALQDIAGSVGKIEYGICGDCNEFKV